MSDKPKLLPDELRPLVTHSLRTLLYGQNGLFDETTFPSCKLAELLHVRHDNLISLLNGQRFPRKSTVEAIAQKLGRTYEELADKLVVHSRRDLFWVGKNVELRERDLTSLSATDVAIELKTYTQRVSALCRSGELKAHRLGSQWRITPDDFAEYRRKIGA